MRRIPLCRLSHEQTDRVLDLVSSVPLGYLDRLLTDLNELTGKEECFEGVVNRLWGALKVSATVLNNVNDRFKKRFSNSNFVQ